MELELPQPPSPGSFVWFSLIFFAGGVSTAAVRLDTVADESSKKMADGVTRSPSRLCSRDGKICSFGDALSTISLLLCLASFSFIFLIFPASRYVHLLRVASSAEQPSATLSKYVFYIIVRVLSACVICTLPHHGIILFFIRLAFFRSSYFSGGVFLCCALVPRTLVLDLPTLISDARFFSVSLPAATEYIVHVSRMNQEGHWGYCWCRWVERTV